MAPKRPNPLDHPPAASSSEEEVEEEDEEVPEQREEAKRPADSSGSEDEDEETDEDEPEEEEEKKIIPPPVKSVSKIPNPQPDESDTESESTSFALRPHTSTPVPTPKLKRRRVEDDKESNSKAKKKAKPDIGGGGGGEGSVSAKKSGSAKLMWSDEDEVAVLKGMIEFRERKGIDPSSDYALFHESVKKSISIEVSKSQLMEKIRRLRNKFRSSEEKDKTGELFFCRNHERDVFVLSKTVWGSVAVKSASVKKKNSLADHNGALEAEEKISPRNKTGSNTIDMKSGKKSGIVVMWSNEDVIEVLLSMFEFREKNGVDPESDSTAFYEFAKKRISGDVSKSQLVDKLRALKNSYIKDTGKGEDPVFSEPIERRLFGLSKLVWGSAGGNVVKKKTSSSDHNGKLDVVMALPKPNFNAFNTISKQEPHHSKVAEAVEVVEQGNFADLYPFLYLSLKSSSLSMVSRDMAEIMERFLVSLDRTKLQELDKEWKKQILNEAQVSMGRSDLLKKQLQLLQADWHSTKG